jgi:hypothetical protein
VRAMRTYFSRSINKDGVRLLACHTRYMTTVIIPRDPACLGLLSEGAVRAYAYRLGRALCAQVGEVRVLIAPVAHAYADDPQVGVMLDYMTASTQW